MNRIVTRMLSVAAFALFICWTADALAQTEEQIKRFNQERNTYFTEKLELTTAEAEAFWPLYNDFFNRKMKIMEDEKNTFRYSNENADNLSDKEITETLDKISRLRSDLCQLEQEYYHEKFQQALPPKKVLKLYKVEWDFRHYLIDKIRDQGQGGPGDRNRDDPGDRGKDAPGDHGKGSHGQGPEQMAPPFAF
jgi:hypothetical protein